MSGLGVLARAINTELIYGITMLFICPGTNELWQPNYEEKILPIFHKVQRQLETRLISGDIFEYTLIRKLLLTNFKTKLELPT